MDTPSPRQSEIKVLSVRQPWADLILMGAKWCENRTWRTKHRGRLFLHGSKWDVEERREWEKEGLDITQESPGGCHTGAIVGFGELVDCVPIEVMDAIYEGRPPDGYEELARRLEGVSEESWDYVVGPWCWLIANTRFLLRPIPAKGKLNVWSFTANDAMLVPKEREIEQ